jgi:hypothetical protein
VTELSIEDVPADIGRNDPCPCGSGKKYKKCHYKIHRVQKEAAKTSRSVEDVVTPATTVWQVHDVLRQVHENNMPGFFWDMMHDASPLRERYPDKEAYLSEIGAGTERLPGAKEYDIQRIRHDGPDTLLLLVRGLDDPKMQTLLCDVITLRPNQFGADRAPRDVEHAGFRLWNLERHEFPKDSVDEELTFTDLDYSWNEAWDAPEGWFKIPEVAE